jgi:hypothetical protein
MKPRHPSSCRHCIYLGEGGDYSLFTCTSWSDHIWVEAAEPTVIVLTSTAGRWSQPISRLYASNDRNPFFHAGRCLAVRRRHYSKCLLARKMRAGT